MKYHNPENVPEEKIPEGWRLLMPHELQVSHERIRSWLPDRQDFLSEERLHHSFLKQSWTYIVPIELVSESPTPSRYQWQFQGASFDFYRLCEILGVSHHAQAHALKKVIRAGRSVKPLTQDIEEAIAALSRWKEMLSEDEASGKEAA